MLNVANATLLSIHITFSTKAASSGWAGSKFCAWLSTVLSDNPRLWPALAKNRLRTDASSFNGAPLLNCFDLWQSLHSLSPGV
jgi:hypothetical protein